MIYLNSYYLRQVSEAASFLKTDAGFIGFFLILATVAILGFFIS